MRNVCGMSREVNRISTLIQCKKNYLQMIKTNKRPVTHLQRPFTYVTGLRDKNTHDLIRSTSSEKVQ
jgi:hypothetical protein